jgi:hypothetical protein
VKDDDRVLREAEAIERADDAAHLRVHETDRGVIGLNRSRRCASVIVSCSFFALP